MLRLYRFPYSTNVERVALALAYKGLEVESVVVDPADRSPVRAVSGQDLVPVLVDGDDVVTDSTRILRAPGGALPRAAAVPRRPGGARGGRALPRLVQPRLEARAEPDHRCARARRGDSADVARWSARLQGRARPLRGLLADRDHLFGAFGAADCAAWPFLRYAVSIEPDDDERFHRVLHERMTLDDAHPNAARLDRRGWPSVALRASQARPPVGTVRPMEAQSAGAGAPWRGPSGG